MSVRSWLHERIPVSGSELRELTNEPVPNHLKSWWFCLGGTVAYAFAVQIVTGILLAFYYQATPEGSYESVRFITEEAAYGWYLRGMHKWGATVMIAALVLHQMRVFFTGAYRRPRELNWMIGMGLLVLTLLTGFTGYSLVYEQLSYWGATVGANICDAVPVLGGLLKRLLLAGDVYNDHTLSRFFVLHAAVLPAAIVLLVIVHLALGVGALGLVEELTDAGRALARLVEHEHQLRGVAGLQRLADLAAESAAVVVEDLLGAGLVSVGADDRKEDLGAGEVPVHLDLADRHEAGQRIPQAPDQALGDDLVDLLRDAFGAVRRHGWLRPFSRSPGPCWSR